MEYLKIRLIFPHDSLEGDAKKRVHTSLLFKKIIETEPSVKATKKQIDDTIDNFAKYIQRLSKS